MNDKRQLLCTFSNLEEYKDVINKLNQFHKIHNNCIFTFYNTKNIKEMFITYNILIDSTKDFSKFPNTISIHRKKQTNTLYTLNSLNKLVEEECGRKNPNYIINWSLFKDSFIITGDVSVRIIPIKIYDILK